MELIKIVTAYQALESLADRNDVGAHLAYWMAKFVTKTESDYMFYISEMRKIIEKYATSSENDGDSHTIGEDQKSAFDDAVHRLNCTNAEDPGIRFKLSELTTELKLSMKQIYPLLDFIDEGQ